VIQLARSGCFVSTTVAGSAEDAEFLRAQFRGQHCIRIPALLEPGMLEAIQRRFSEVNFRERVHEGIGSNKELCVGEENPLSRMLNFLMNNVPLFRLVEQVTGCGRIGCFTGRVYRLVPGCGHHDSWHSDWGEHRMLGMSVNLSTGVYSGGALQIRDRSSGLVVHEVANVGFGDAIIFRLADHLQHRLTEVEGDVPKTALAGWFCSRPDLFALLKEHSG
jgi:hypothetical protein